MFSLRECMKKSGKRDVGESRGVRRGSWSEITILVSPCCYRSSTYTDISQCSSRSMGYLYQCNQSSRRPPSVFLQSSSKLLNQPHCCSNLEAHPPVDLHQVVLCGNPSIFL